MTVAELIERLQQLDGEYTVLVSYEADTCRSPEIEVTTDHDVEHGNVALVVV